MALKKFLIWFRKLVIEQNEIEMQLVVIYPKIVMWEAEWKKKREKKKIDIWTKMTVKLNENYNKKKYDKWTPKYQLIYKLRTVIPNVNHQEMAKLEKSSKVNVIGESLAWRKYLNWFDIYDKQKFNEKMFD
jgi:uncharacterized ubiquitin-like protein YukD